MTRSFERDDKPLDPAQERIVRRMRRLMLLSSLIMIGGFLVVFGVIGYRLFTRADKAEPAEVRVSLPKGARVVSTAVADGKLVVTIDVGAAVEVRVFDIGTLEPRGRMTFDPAP